ncbi:MAG TPA: sigma-70 family RNA polymerase sigma factor [Polyangiaceae bacterium]
MVPSLAVADADDHPAEGVDRARLDELVRAEFAYVWRLCRRLGLPESDADDAAQQVFIVASRRLADIRSGSERAFLYGVAVNAAAKFRASHARRREESDAGLEFIESGSPNAEELVDQRGARALLDWVLDSMPGELREVFVLYEIEQQTTAQIAEVLGIPYGTAASRLRRARDDFSARLARLEARRRFEGARR